MENPFIPGIMALLLVGEPITKKESVVYIMVTVGLYCISYKEGGLQVQAAGSKDEYVVYESLGIALTCVASAI